MMKIHSKLLLFIGMTAVLAAAAALCIAFIAMNQFLTRFRLQESAYSSRIMKDTAKTAIIYEAKLIDEQANLLFVQLENLLKNKVTPIPVKVIAVMRYLYKYGETDFERILLNNETRSDVIATFAAVLELVKFQRVFISGDEENPTLTLNLKHDKTPGSDRTESAGKEIY